MKKIFAKKINNQFYYIKNFDLELTMNFLIITLIIFSTYYSITMGDKFCDKKLDILLNKVCTFDGEEKACVKKLVSQSLFKLNKVFFKV